MASASGIMVTIVTSKEATAMNLGPRVCVHAVHSQSRFSYAMCLSFSFDFVLIVLIGLIRIESSTFQSTVELYMLPLAVITN